MDTSVRPYRSDLDVLKAIAVLAVVCYHLGYLSTGYLGVDVFFVVNGFLVIPPLLKSGLKPQELILWIVKRLMRLYPVVLIASAVCLALGYIALLPDGYENLAQSVVATDLFANNILQAITTRNYWDVVNDYKPLMHTWYLGVLVQFYVFYALVVCLSGLLSDCLKVSRERFNPCVLGLLTFLSLGCYLYPAMPDVARFYYLPCRFFEMGLGGLVGWLIMSRPKAGSRTFIGFMWLFLLVVLLSGWLQFSRQVSYHEVMGTVRDSAVWLPKMFLLLLTVFATCLIVSQDNNRCKPVCWLANRSWLTTVGKMTLSLFVWHQVVLAFMRLYVGEPDTVWSLAVYVIAVLALSLFTYYGVERRVAVSGRSVSVTAISLVVLLSVSMTVYARAGVVRDVPELRVKAGSTQGDAFDAYCDRVYQYDRDFPSPNGRKNVLVVGKSFGRDFVNILLESERADSINISYLFDFDRAYEKRYRQADCLFLFCDRPAVPDYVIQVLKPASRLIGIGPKNFGTDNARIYVHRDSPDYFSQTVAIDEGFRILNRQWKHNWGSSHYIDMIQVVERPDGRIRVFTDDHAFISQDCRHLTPDGAKFYAEKLINHNQGRNHYGL